MRAQDLRINNIIEIWNQKEERFKPIRVTAQMLVNMDEFPEGKYYRPLPIPVEKVKDNLEGYILKTYPFAEGLFMTYPEIEYEQEAVSVKFVHEIQNLYKELEKKEVNFDHLVEKTVFKKKEKKGN